VDLDRTQRALSDELLIFVSRPFLHGEKLKILRKPSKSAKIHFWFVQREDQNELMTDQGNLTTIQEIGNQEKSENSRKIKSKGGIHEILTRGQWAE
jgi:hypothetical protein